MEGGLELTLQRTPTDAAHGIAQAARDGGYVRLCR